MVSSNCSVSQRLLFQQIEALRDRWKWTLGTRRDVDPFFLGSGGRSPPAGRVSPLPSKGIATTHFRFSKLQCFAVESTPDGSLLW